jgi:hypothetical protein
MLLNEYIKNSTRTESIVNEITVPNTRILHAVLGITTESTELLKNKSNRLLSNYVEKLGNICWYLAILIDELKITPHMYDLYVTNFTERQEIQYLIIDKCVDNIIILAGELLNLIKQNYFYNQELAIYDVTIRINNIFKDIHFISANIYTSVSKILELNIEKLKKRYPEKYIPNNVINRETNEYSN